MRSMVFKRDELKYFRFLLICFLLFTVTTSLYSKEFNKYDRIYALSNIWKEMSYNFAFPEKVLDHINADSLYRAYLPKVESQMDDYDFYKLLSSYFAYFNEAHTRAYISDSLIDNPPLFAINLEGKIIVDNISKELEKEIPIGSEIIKINNIPINNYITDSVAIYVSASTSHWKRNKSVLELFNGRLGSSIMITIRDNNEKEKDIKLIRNYKQLQSKLQMVKQIDEAPIVIEFKKNDIAYIKLNSFMYPYKDSIENTFIKALPMLRKAKGLIIDIRKNRGGSDTSWYLIANYLLKDKEYDLPIKTYSKKHISKYVEWGKYYPQLSDYAKGIAMEELPSYNKTNNVPDSLKLNQPLVVLSGDFTGSAAEDFLLLMKYVKKSLIVGTPSVGCVGEPSFFELNDNIGFMICTKKFVVNDGTQPIDKGILPDITVEMTYKDYLKNRDTVLERAIKELGKLININD